MGDQEGTSAARVSTWVHEWVRTCPEILHENDQFYCNPIDRQNVAALPFGLCGSEP